MSQAAAFLVACAPGSRPCGPDAACAAYEIQIDAAVRVPQNHRASSSTCPPQRAPGAIDSACNYDAGPPVACLRDTDCSAGKNGRCLDAPPVVCATACSYDACFADPDCPGNVCDCRPSASDSRANVCAGGNCRIDADCGPGGYCSRSASCTTISYFCHTANDTCVDDGDCPLNQSCIYQPQVQAWACSRTCSPPL